MALLLGWHATRCSATAAGAKRGCAAGSGMDESEGYGNARLLRRPVSFGFWLPEWSLARGICLAIRVDRSQNWMQSEYDAIGLVGARSALVRAHCSPCDFTARCGCARRLDLGCCSLRLLGAAAAQGGGGGGGGWWWWALAPRCVAACSRSWGASGGSTQARSRRCLFSAASDLRRGDLRGHLPDAAYVYLALRSLHAVFHGEGGLLSAGAEMARGPLCEGPSDSGYATHDPGLVVMLELRRDSREQGQGARSNWSTSRRCMPCLMLPQGCADVVYLQVQQSGATHGSTRQAAVRVVG